MLNRRLAIASLLLAALAAAAPAQADLTAFLGYSPTPFNRSARGVAVGFGFLIVFDTPPFDLRTSWWIVPIAHALIALPLLMRRNFSCTPPGALRTIG